MATYHEGDSVSRAWDNGRGEGEVEKTFTRTVTRTLEGSEITRNGSPDASALLIEQEDGDEVLKPSSEVDAA